MDERNPDKKLSRRDFLKLSVCAGAGALGAALAKYSEGLSSLISLADNNLVNLVESGVCDQESMDFCCALNQLWQKNIKKFKYEADVAGDAWVLPVDTQRKVRGDCEDFAIVMANDLNTLSNGKDWLYNTAFLVSRSVDGLGYSAHAGLLVFDRKSRNYYLLDNGAYEYKSNRGFIDFGVRESGAPYNLLKDVIVGGNRIHDAYIVGGDDTKSQFGIDRLQSLSDSKYWNKVYHA